MKIEELAPTEVVEEGPTDGTRRSHPAFGVIKASRFQGGHETMYGSPLVHGGGISITISHSDEYVSLGHSHYWENRRGQIVELHMSEAQWAAFISTLNVGSGSPCTLQYVRTGEMERMPRIVEESLEEKRSQFIRDRAEEQNKVMTEALRFFDGLLEGGSVKKGDLQKLRSMLRQVGDHFASNMQFTADTLTKHNEDLITSAKVEVSAMVTRMHMQFPQLAGQDVQIGQIEDQSDGN